MHKAIKIIDEALLYDIKNDNREVYYALVNSQVNDDVQYVILIEGPHSEDKFSAKDDVSYEMKIYLPDTNFTKRAKFVMDSTQYKVYDLPDYYRLWGRSILNRWARIENDIK